MRRRKRYGRQRPPQGGLLSHPSDDPGLTVTDGQHRRTEIMSDEIRVWVRRRKLSSRGKEDRFTYHARWICPIEKCWKSRKLGTDQKRAEVEALKLEEEILLGSYRAVKRVSWSDFVAEHMASLDCAESTKADVKWTLDEFGKVCGPPGPQAVTFRMVEAFVASLKKRGNKLATRHKRLRYLQGVFNKAVKRDYLARNPMDKWEWAREEDKIPRVLTDVEKLLLLEACPSTQWHTLVGVALVSGCRVSELVNLEWRNVDFDNSSLIITGTKAKRDRVQPIPDSHTAVLRELQASTIADGGPFKSLGTRKNVADGFRRIVEAAGIEYCTFHDLRRTFCTDLARLGVNQLIVQKLAGHADASTTAKYYQHVDDPMKRDAVAKLSRSAG
jgi:integrase